MAGEKRMSTPARVALIFLVIMAVGVGAYWLGHERGLADALVQKMEPVDDSHEVSRLRDENARLVAENNRLAAEHAAPEPAAAAPAVANAPAEAGTMERLHTLAELQQKKLATVVVQMVNPRTGKLQDSFAELFNLTPAEKDTLQQALDQARQQTEQLMAANASLSRSADGAVVISVAPLDAGSSIKEGLMDAFAQTLGPDRNEAFVALQSNGPNQLSNALGGFGTQQRTITLSRTTSPDGSRQMISVRDEQRSPAGPGSMTSMSSIPSTGALPPNLSWAQSLLPPDF
jgi:hypothetical protein